MAKKKEGAKGKEGGGKKKTIIMVVVVAVAFLAGSKLMGGGGSAAVAGAVVPTTIPDGEVKALDSITLNLADGRLLKVGVALQKKYDPEAGAAGAGGHGAAAASDDPTKGYARALDIVIDVMSHHTMAELVKPEVREEAKAKLIEELNHAYHDEIEDVYFHEFVMQ